MFRGDPAPELVCHRCPFPEAQDYQFRFGLRALLRNAPDWVVAALSRLPEAFFRPVDFNLLNREIALLRNPPEPPRPEADDLARLRDFHPDDPWLRERTVFLLSLYGPVTK